MFHAFPSTFEVPFYTIHGQNITLRFTTEGFAPVYRLCGVVSSPYWFIKFLIGKTGNIYYDSCTSMQNVCFNPKPVCEP